jgi:hypothetical protein
MAGRPSPRHSRLRRALVLGAVALACDGGPAPIAAEDARALRTTAHLDDRTLALVREAEAAARGGEAVQAAARLDAAEAAAVRAVEAADALTLATRAGRAAQGELSGILERRREAIALYRGALAAQDDVRTVEALRVAREVETALVDWERSLRDR